MPAGDPIPTHTTLRPLRLAFVIDADDAAAFVSAVETSTCLWGGIRNPIIPVHRRSTRRYRVHPIEPPSAEAIVRGYLEVFEPDVIVAADPAATSSLLSSHAIPIIKLDDALKGARAGNPDFGISMLSVYDHLYHTTFRFVRRRTPSVMRPGPPPEGMNEFSAAKWGRLPPSDVGHIRRVYDEVFEPVEVPCTPAYANAAGQHVTASPLTLTRAEIRGWFGGGDATVFILNHRRLMDLYAYWNLRALGARILAVPLEWVDEEAERIRAFVRNHRIPADERGFGERYARIVKGQCVSRRQFQGAVDTLALGEDAWCHPDVPPMWSPDFLRRGGVNPGCVVADERWDDAPRRYDRASIVTLSPSFVSGFNPHSSERWCNVIRILHGVGDMGQSLVFPDRAANLDELLDDTRFGAKLRLVRDGIAVTCDKMTDTLRWRIPDGSELVSWWYEQQGYDPTPSGSGLIAEGMLRALGGPLGMNGWSHATVVRLLDSMNSTQARLGRSRREIEDALREDLTNAQWPISSDPAEVVDLLIERRVLRLGVEVQCEVCQQRNWYQLNALSETLACERCLAEYPFPARSPPPHPWRYRPQGPFAIENAAHGAYAVVLALRFFILTLHGDASWRVGIELRPKGDSGGAMEVDLTLFWKRGHMDGKQAEHLIVECKSFNTPFDDHDMDRTRRLAEAFPNAVFVMATLAPDLSSAERHRLRKLRGDLPVKNSWQVGPFRPLLILAEAELFSTWGPPKCWQDAGGRHAVVAEASGNVWSLESLCSATQEIYLGNRSGGGPRDVCHE